ncbi:1-acyl-sn-glycerol-3-phosphate acyltransferase [Campylobacter hepaticus]|uniref:1-acyl-sn-glycerol-3-phosphate acyltransferase n=1 Tax=Campylobacter hepaticus TaxID=1813019 RepID=A0A6A7JT18_9BACT|nr:lysophospholipid acyltransferase family protein [Campylobacter hepaticus]AXP08965.1 1-acyl-sn-glycerol-3-phosphate acyltransferase [Campylobacter hepaticus]MCZ0771995.1 1-acyl-sn-glycerol-3-phosphate acyltransferase [Campylobacter hepaticus]MCZ0773464.1 1-acyl-sn-glycerol-3-phosphate acyltransferase [Campylobacter hepaticus]MCZ0774714.1 1-acyl-sn-glycerol-3-phosphate acyltransferase [Campylobacter hepaticus]MDX2323768.1 lysophospholipid acyltransferase family protein [Campylobacter hepaticu
MIYRRIKAFYFWCFFIVSVAFVVFCFCFIKSQNRLWKIRKIWAKCQKYVLWYKSELIGNFNLDANMILINHQSTLDIIVLEELYPKNLCWIAKKELGEIPFFKIAIKKPKLLCIDRKNPRDLMRVLKEAKERLNENRVLAIFPEGTRSKNTKLLKFQNGTKILSDKLNLKVQPILLIDSAKILDTKSFSAKSGTLKIICMDLVDTNDEKWLEKTRKKMQEILDQERAKIC